MPTGALAPLIRYVVMNDGAVVPGAKAYFFASGTSTPLNVYNNADLAPGHEHTNPVIADSEGVLPPIYFLPRSYRVLITDSSGATVFPATDDVYDWAELANAGGIQATVLGTYGTSITAGQVVYLSDGSGALTAGRWYLADADFTYASNLAPAIGIALVTGIAGDSALIAVNGRVTNQSGLAAGTLYYVSATAGALTSTAPANARLVGVGDSTTSLVITQSANNVTQGSWTPAIGGSGGQSGQVYSDQLGRYTKIGRTVWCWMRVTLSTLGTITTNVQITGLPVNVDNDTTGSMGTFDISFTGMTTSVISITGVPLVNSGTISMFMQTAAATSKLTTPLAQGDLSATTGFRAQFSYRAAS